MTEILKMAGEIIEDGNLNKLNQLLSNPMSQDLAQTIRRIFFYLQEQKLFTIKYGSEWSQWFCSNFQIQQESNQIEKFLNVKWSVFLRLLFQNSLIDELLNCVEHSPQCPPYVRLVQQSIENNFEIFFEDSFLEVILFLNMNFDKLFSLVKRIPELNKQQKKLFTTFIQQQIKNISQNQENRLRFTKIINTHIVDKVENPLILADFLQNNIDQGDLELQINSIQSMLILITRYHYNLENFYEKLIQIIKTEGSFQNQSTSKLLKLIDVATKSSKVPLQILSQIISQVLFQCIKETCALQLWAVSLTFNIFKKHPTLKQFLQCGNQQISELASYQDHWHPEIKKIVNYLQEDLSVFDYFNLNDLTELTDNQLFEAQF